MGTPWQSLARCRTKDTNWFFDPKNELAVAATCQTCEVREPCYQYAIDEKIDEGVWGGYRFQPKRVPRKLTAAANRTTIKLT
jgi:hypothetical protein